VPALLMPWQPSPPSSLYAVGFFADLFASFPVTDCFKVLNFLFYLNFTFIRLGKGEGWTLDTVLLT